MPHAPAIKERFVPACSCKPAPVETAAPIVRGLHKAPGPNGAPSYVSRVIETSPPACRECRAEWKRFDRLLPDA